MADRKEIMTAEWQGKESTFQGREAGKGDAGQAGVGETDLNEAKVRWA